MQDSLSSQQNQASQTGLVGKFELKTLTPNHPVGYIVHDTLTASPRNDISPSVTHQTTTLPLEKEGGKRKRTRRAKSCKDKEQAEIQRITHIAVERNRRKMMNEHLEILKSIMPESYIHRGDQASIVGGAIEYVKALEHLLQTLEVQKLLVATASTVDQLIPPSPPFSQFFSYPQYTFTTEENNAGDNNSNINTDNCMVTDNNYNYTTTSSSTRSNDVADIEVSLIETRANVRIFSRRNFLQLSKLTACFQSISLSILHLNVTTLDPMVLYSISAKLCKPGRQGTFTTTTSASVSLSTSSFLRLKKSANSAQRMK